MNLQLHSPETDADPVAPVLPVVAKVGKPVRPRRAAAKAVPNALPGAALSVPKAAVKTAAKQGAKQGAKVAAKPAPSKTARAPSARKAAGATKAADAAKAAPVAAPKSKRQAPPVAPAAPPAGKQKHKLVRDSFTIPKDEYGVLVGLKQRAGQLAHHAKKSEILRAGVQLLSGLPDAAFLAALASVPSLKTGRPKQDAAAPAPSGGKKSAR